MRKTTACPSNLHKTDFLKTNYNMATTDNDLITCLSSIRINDYKLLTERARKFYTAKCNELLKAGELRRSWLQSLLIWADNYDRYWTLRDEVDVEGYTFTVLDKNHNTVIKANPKVRMMQDAQKVAQSILADFGGTTYKSRKLGKEPAPPTSPLDDFFAED